MEHWRNPFLEHDAFLAGIISANLANGNTTQRRIQLIRLISETLQSTFPSTRAYAFGSVATGLDLANSDLDLVVIENLNQRPRKLLERVLDVLRHVLRRFGPHEISPIRSARVPIVKISCPDGIACDISFNTDSGLRSTDLIKQYVQRYPGLIPSLVRLLKLWRSSRGLPDASMGGLSSFAWTIVMICFLKGREKQFPQGPTFSLFDVMAHFFYSLASFPPGKMVASLRRGGIFVDNEKGRCQNGWLCIESPDDPGIDISRSLSRATAVIFINEVQRGADILRRSESNPSILLALLERPSKPPTPLSRKRRREQEDDILGPGPAEEQGQKRPSQPKRPRPNNNQPSSSPIAPTLSTSSTHSSLSPPPAPKNAFLPIAAPSRKRRPLSRGEQLSLKKVQKVQRSS
mmetsp:Transcript_37060/g.60027  ORF Transcript_37060/g.60027 Transcript_37060/m.60027 type:complete len:404 (-) Transcript_37060:1021-2232(-)